MSEQAFVVAYDGPAIEGHVMDVADLAGSLLALSAAIKRAQRVVNPDVPLPSLHIKATGEGSFEVTLSLMQPDLIEGMLNVLLSREAQATVTAGGLFAMWIGALRYILKVKGRRIREVKPHPEPGMVIVVLIDGDEIEDRSDVVEIARDIEFRQHAENAVAPLDKEGIESFTISDGPRGKGKVVEVTDDDLPYLRAPALPDEELVDEPKTRPATVQPVGVEFDWRKWRVTEGGVSFAASVDDTAFQGQVERQEITLGKNDLLKVQLRTEQYRDKQGALRARYAIVRVDKHIPGGRQEPLAFDAE